MTYLKKDWPLILIASLPFVYTLYVWPDLPYEVPMQWRLDTGRPNKYGSKTDLALLAFFMPAVTYIVFWLIARLQWQEDQKKTSTRFKAFKNVVIIFVSALGLYVVNASVRGGPASTNWIILTAGALCIWIGSYLKTLPPNYILGIRTPWTLKNELVWFQTHRFAGRLWLLTGLALMAGSFRLPPGRHVVILIGSVLLLSGLPTLYSFIKYRSMNRNFR